MLSVALLAAAASAVIKVGDTLPSVTLDFGFPPEKINLLENSRKKLHGRCLELFGALTMTRARVHELETLLYLKHMVKEVGLPSPFAHFSDC